MLLLLLAGLLSPVSLSGRPLQAGCLPYGPDTVSVAGNLERRIYPGRPNYASIAEGDGPETGFHLRLSQPVCTIADTTMPDAPPLHGVRLVQLAVDSTGYTVLRSCLGQRVVLRGTLFGALTGHHYAPLLPHWRPNGTTKPAPPARGIS